MKRKIYKIKTEDSTKYFISTVVHPDGTLEAKGLVKEPDESIKAGLIKGLSKNSVQSENWDSVEKIVIGDYDNG